ncbi:type II toxin-antitoxin system VapC family toxin [Asanoa sp. WMMD1127]|uniref:type II toxin-antitoxin system VapC family toxin n=1 Tax=Asanoa sp. WMMD1127 TaxID=3016107 RepID=UPI002416D58C|nr:type II toxin-antitoxin system VapC family toxin [Asanoa sp. WMMD1127]MDG4820986.1 type II toxin-antitoxin system VapC family toxin [Asanoa sp. WMMD1127]
MRYVVLDTDVASHVFRGKLDGRLAGRLTASAWCLTFVTVGELTQWAAMRDWSPRNLGALEAFMSRCLTIDGTWETARTWGRLSAAGRRRGRMHPINDAWIAASCLTEGLPLATLNTKDYADFAEHHGLALV